MWVGKDFPEDNDMDLAWIQHDLYSSDGSGYSEFYIKHGDYLCGSCYYIFEMARESVTRAPFMLPVYKNLNEIQGIDHRVLQAAHQQMAAFYRWLQSQQKNIPPLSGNETSYRDWCDKFPKRLSVYHKYVLEAWKSYFIQEVYDITHGQPSVSEHVIEAVLYKNTKKGYKAEASINDFLTLRYGKEFEKIHEDWIKET